MTYIIHWITANPIPTLCVVGMLLIGATYVPWSKLSVKLPSVQPSAQPVNRDETIHAFDLLEKRFAGNAKATEALKIVWGEMLTPPSGGAGT